MQNGVDLPQNMLSDVCLKTAGPSNDNNSGHHQRTTLYHCQSVCPEVVYVLSVEVQLNEPTKGMWKECGKEGLNLDGCRMECG